MKPAILITGGAGYIGCHTSYLFSQNGYKVLILDTLVHEQLFNHTWATLIKKDFSDEETLKLIFKNYNIKAVMHFAAFIEVGQSVKDPLRFYENNVNKTIKLLKIMLAHGVDTFIFSSSCAVYGSPEYLPLTEDHPKNPMSPYGRNKLIIEMALEDFKKAYGLQYISLRYFNAAGAMPKLGLGEQHKPETHIIPLILRAAREQKPFYIFGNNHPTQDGSCVRDYIHVWDIAHAHWLAFQYLIQGNPADSFNLGTGNGFSVRQIIRSVEKVCGYKVKTINAKKREGDPPLLIADPAKVFTILGWKPRYSDLDHIIETAHAFEQQLQRRLGAQTGFLTEKINKNQINQSSG